MGFVGPLAQDGCPGGEVAVPSGRDCLQPDVPSYSFNKLRRTSATRILEISDAETASMILAHKTIGEDELPHHYALLPWNKLYAAQKALEEQLALVPEASGPDPWVMDVPPSVQPGLHP